jgi:hypothetical protein
VVHAFKSLRPYLLDKLFELHTDKASLQWLQQQQHLSHHHWQARWLNLLAEFHYRVVHIPGLTNPADFLTRKRFPDGVGPARHTGYPEPDSGLELFTTHDPSRPLCSSPPVPSTLPLRRTSVRRSWAASCSTGGRTMAGSAAPSPAFARVPRSRT